MGDRYYILIVDDDPSISKLYAIKLKSEGFDVKVSARGDEALATTAKENPDLLLLDVQMPFVNGLDVIRFLRKKDKFKDLPIIVLTNLEDEKTEREAKSMGVIDYLQKTKTIPKDVVGVIRKTLSGKKPRERYAKEDYKKPVMLRSRRVVTGGYRAGVNGKGDEKLLAARDEIVKERLRVARLASAVMELKSMLTMEREQKQKALQNSRARAEAELKNLQEELKAYLELEFKKKRDEELIVMMKELEDQKSRTEEELAKRDQLLKMESSAQQIELKRTIEDLKAQLTVKENIWQAKINRKEKELKEEKKTKKKVKKAHERKLAVSAVEDELSQLKAELAHVKEARGEVKAPPTSPTRPYKFLIIEDDPIIGRLYKVKLELMGHKVFDTPSGKIGLEIVKNENPDLVLLDIMLQDIGGIEFLRSMRETNPDLPVIVLTNLDDEKTKKDALDLGAKDYIIKADALPKEVIAQILKNVPA